MKLKTLFLKFLGVGACGFIIDVTIFQLLFLAGGGLIVPRVVSASIAITATWFLNRRHVFQTHKAGPMGPEYGRYVGVQLVGLLVNFIFYFTSLAVIPALRELPVIAIAIGAGAALLVNFAGARWWVYRLRHDA